MYNFYTQHAIENSSEYGKAVPYSTVLHPTFHDALRVYRNDSVFSMAWHKLVAMLSLVCIPRKIQVTRGLFHGKSTQKH